MEEEKIQKEKKGLGITALSFGIASVLFCLSVGLGELFEVLAIVFGIVAIVKKNGKGMAIAGLICGIVALLITANSLSMENTSYSDVASSSTSTTQSTETAEEIAERKAREKEEAEERARLLEEQKEKEEEDFKDSCEKYSFKEIARNPDDFKGKKVKFTGEVIQVSEGWSNSIDIRLNVTKDKYGWYEDTIYCTYTYPESGKNKILEDDIITVYGICEGDYTYTSVLGASVTLPKVSVKYVELDD